MKKLILTTILASGGLMAVAQTAVKKSEVPEAVVKSYVSQNSRGANDSLWEKEIITVYKIKHTIDGRTYESQYSSDGKWIKTFTIITADELPLTVVNQIKATYPEFTIHRTMIELSNNGKLYAIELRRGKDTIMEYFLMSGQAYR